jgi:hypothetical protein
VRRDYELSDEPVSSIKRRWGLTDRQFRKMREGEGWTTRPQVARPGPLQGHKPVGSDALELRTSALLAVGLARLGRSISDEGFTEDNARRLTELCRAQGIFMRMTKSGRSGNVSKAARLGGNNKKNDDAGTDFRDDPTWLRAQLEQEILRIRRARGLEETPQRGDG